MDDELPSSETLAPSSPISSSSTSQKSKLDLSKILPITILSAHFKNNEEKELENNLRQYGAPLTIDDSKVKILIGKVGTKRRAEFELRKRKFRVEEVSETKRAHGTKEKVGPPSKRRKIYGSSSRPIRVEDGNSTTEPESDVETVDEADTEDGRLAEREGIPLDISLTAEAHSVFKNETKDDIIWVVGVDWLDTCIEAGHLLPLQNHLVYKGKVFERPAGRPARQSIKSAFSTSPLPKAIASTLPSRKVVATRPDSALEILERAKLDASGEKPKAPYQPKRQFHSHGSRRFEGKTFAPSALQGPGHLMSQQANLLQQTTSEYDGSDTEFPAPPVWVVRGIKYSCQRQTPMTCLNEEFVDLLKKIRTARILIDDSIGVRAYSTIIASIAAYPYKFVHPREIIQIPGCDEKTVQLWVEWKNTNMIKAVEDFKNDEAMKVLRTFYDIWGVGARTARSFYYNHHWTDLDDIIEFGWNDLDRVQQIGLKYYEEFLEPIPRAEVEQIASVVREHAVRLRDERVTVTLVGGYRRGKEASGDVDMIVSHPDILATANLVQDLVESLEEAEWITHTLTLSLHNTHRGQSTLPFRTTKASGAGFDTLDKALVVWQNPEWPTREEDLAANENVKNPNIHRRVDIIVSPWRTVGCAVMGWSGGTTFQRDLRRYAKAVKGWKFDSSGIRSRENGEVVMIEGEDGVSEEEGPGGAERRVFEGLGLKFIEPEMRCTG
ncbi:Nucleotidyltransferase [Amniculicola lignicola CBS 123094]|uniref:DNA-directed DNA polymerase n=1 Tax=Amniculicola lignicola CBS 123094 TaxID=1392246 RepID=A0A6A5WJI1_9PLEO|nr:Nucleotidyltransferase [Amniculicola lignicola CBS 123094]